jgi:hypothetical protein
MNNKFAFISMLVFTLLILKVNSAWGEVIFPKEKWPASTPELQGMSSAKLSAVPSKIGRAIVIRHGYDIWHYGDPYANPDTWWASCARSFTTVTFGIAIKQGIIPGGEAVLDQPVNSLNSSTAKGYSSSILLKHLLSYTACSNPPGSGWAYNCKWFSMHYILDELWMHPKDVVNQHLVPVLGGNWRAIGPQSDYSHRVVGSPAELARWAYLWLHRGKWEDTQVVDPWFVDRTVEPMPKPSGGGYANINEGWQIHINRGGKWTNVPLDAYAALGAAATGVIFACPSLDLVVARTGPEPSQHDQIGEFIGPICQAVVADSTPPTIPQNLSAVPLNESSIQLTWSASTDNETGVFGYFIYRNNVKMETTSPTFIDTNLEELTTYTYQVSAVNTAGAESDKSTLKSATTLSDAASPEILSVTCSGDPSRVIVVFSEKVDHGSSSTPGNYTIDNSISVSQAVLGMDERSVILSTSEHNKDVNYTLTVNNIKDQAKTANTIAPNTQRTYMYFEKLELTGLTAASGKAYAWDMLAVGKNVYIDRSYTFSNISQDYLGAQVLITANDDKSGTANPFISFDVNQNVTVYVGYASTGTPGWLSSWTSTGNEIQTTDRTLYLYSKDFSMGRVTLGGNESAQSMYTVIVVPAEGPVVESDMQHLFPSRISARVHPNPCHNSIRIQVDLPIDLKVDYSIYDVKGREVFASEKSEFSKGRHTILWNPARVSPGIFFIRIRAGKNCIIRKIILLK